MCLGIPGEIVELHTDHPDLATVRVEGVARPVNVGLLRDDGEQLRPGDWVLIHLGFALARTDEATAKASLAWVTGTGDEFATLGTGEVVDRQD
ncbi:MAG TPA: HypC/HybG/HupF family hydrogenase formation chaperone [Pseudonocardia sp.]|nr:HypC/HybG/HupF family hydrogenase formation chaperone [Pseudonocardia sp.]